MQFDISSDKPIFLQVAEWLEDAILLGAFAEEAQIPSITELSVSNKINPATALKGINLLVDGGILYKKRGVGMFVASGAQSMLKEKRRDSFYQSYVAQLVAEAKRLKLTSKDVHEMIDKGFEK